MKKFAKLAIVLALALTLVIGVTACGSDDEKTDKTYVAAMEATFPPFNTKVGTKGYPRAHSGAM